MKHHDGTKRINKVDGGKKRAKKQYHKKIRSIEQEQIRRCLCCSYSWIFLGDTECPNCESNAGDFI